jgi:hypothetical protein
MASWALAAIESRIEYVSDVRSRWHVQLLALQFGPTLHIIYERLVIG